MTESTGKPVPTLTMVSRHFWEACAAQRLELQQCRGCSRFQYYPRALCRYCGSTALTWKEISGLGTVHSFTVVRRAPTDAFRADVPYVLALVDLEEGPRLMTNIVGADHAHLRIGMPVEVMFEPIPGTELAIPKFRPRQSPEREGI